MEISLKARDFVEQIDNFSQHKLTNRDAIELLIELTWATPYGQQRIDEIAFLSKFLSNTYGILKRSTSETEGYEKLTGEFQKNLEKVIEELKGLVDAAPPETKEKFSSMFLTMSAESFENLMNLLHDLSWLKNWYIDQKSSA